MISEIPSGRKKRGRRVLYIARVPTCVHLEGICKAFFDINNYKISEYINNMLLDVIEKWISENRSDGDPIKKSYITTVEAQLPEIRTRRYQIHNCEVRRLRKIKQATLKAQAEAKEAQRKAAVHSKVEEALARVFPQPGNHRVRLSDPNGDHIEWWENMARAATREAGLRVEPDDCRRYILKHMDDGIPPGPAGG